MWVSPPNLVEAWIQAEPWRRSARKVRSGWRSSTGCDVCNEIVSAWNITTSGKCVVIKSTQQCHTSWAPLNINRGCLVEQLTDQSLVIVRMEVQKHGRKDCKKSDICRTVDNLRHKKLFRLLLKAEEIGSNASIKIDKISMTQNNYWKDLKY